MAFEDFHDYCGSLRDCAYKKYNTLEATHYSALAPRTGVLHAGGRKRKKQTEHEHASFLLTEHESNDPHARDATLHVHNTHNARRIT